MPQFLIDPHSIQGHSVSLPGPEAKHLVKVLRYRAGDSLWVSDGKNRWRACVETITPKGAVLKLLEKQTLQANAVSPALGLALLKKDHLEWVIQKGVELGCAEFFLFTSQRTIPHPAQEKTEKKTARLEKIALEAAKQSGMIGRPAVHAPSTFAELVEKFSNFDAVFLAWEEETRLNFRAAFKERGAKKVLLAVGPEGGLTNEEANRAVQAGARTISLGNQILRSETAAVALLTLCQYELGNL